MSESSNSLPEIGDLVAGRYRIVREIGRGGYGVVFLAHQETIERDVAIKFLLPDIASNPTEVERFRREVFHASSLEHHHTVTLFDYGKSPTGSFYVVMEYLDGDALGDHINAQGRLEPYQTRLLLEQVLGSLDEAHRRQLVHRDLKPENIFINDLEEGELDCRVLDFGLSKFVGDPRSTLYRGPSLTAEGEICGTPQYMSPEHAYGETVGPPADIYSLGLLLYEALTGKMAFDGPTPLDILLKQVKEPVPPVPEELADTTTAKFIALATPKEPEERFSDAGEALQWLYQQPTTEQETPPSASSGTPSGPNILAGGDEAPTKTPPSFTAATSVPPSPAGTDKSSPAMNAEPTESTKSRFGPSSTVALSEEVQALSEEVQALDETVDAREVSRADGDAAPAPKVPETSGQTQRKVALERFELRAAQVPLIGRRQTLARLDSWLDQAVHTGGVFCLTADAGSGKTAVLNTWCSRLSSRQTLHLLRGTQPRNAPALTGLNEAFDDLLDASGSSQHKPTIRLTVEDSFKLQRLLSASTDPDSSPAGNSVVQDLTKIIDRLCEQQPVLLVFDDLHHADVTTQQFFTHLVRSLTERQRPLAVLVTTRDAHALASWKRITNAPLVHWALPNLSKKDLHALLQRLVPVSDGLEAGILRLASGNPALLFHICRYLIESDLIEFRTNRKHWALCDPSIPIEEMVPLDLQQLIIERANRYLDQSSDEPALRSILHRAVLLGDEFDASLLEACLQAEGHDELKEKCRSLLAQLSASGLLEQFEHFDELHYGFARPLHRASLVRMVESIDDWRSFHQLAADILIDRGNQEQQHANTRIAHHLERAGKPSQALAWWVRAARRAESEHRYQDALRMLHRALRLHSNRDADPEVLAAMRLRQGRLSRHVGEMGPAEDALRVAIDHAQRCENTRLRAQAAELLAEVVLLQGRLEEASQLLDKIDDLYQLLRDEKGTQRVDLNRASLALFQGHYEQASQIFERILSSSVASDLSKTEARSLVGLSRCQYARGDLKRALDTAEEARHRAHHGSHFRIEAAAIVEMAHISLLTDGLEASESLAHQALALARREHDLLGQADAHLALGIALRRSTNIDRAIFHSRRARELHESLGHLYGLLKDILLSAELAWAQGELERALILAEDASSLHQELGDQHGWALSTVFRSLFLIELDRPAEARQQLREVLDIEGREQLGLYEPTCLLYMGLACEAELEIDEAMANFAEAKRIATKSSNRELLSLSAVNQGKLHLVLGDFEAAREEISLALAEAEATGHASANVFGLLGTTILARLDGDPERLRDSMNRLRTYLATPNTPDMGLRYRLRIMTRLLQHLPDSPERIALSEAITDIRDDLAPPS